MPKLPRHSAARRARAHRRFSREAGIKGRTRRRSGEKKGDGKKGTEAKRARQEREREYGPCRDTRATKGSTREIYHGVDSRDRSGLMTRLGIVPGYTLSYNPETFRLPSRAIGGTTSLSLSLPPVTRL